MATAEQVLEVARSQLGVREDPSGSNPYGIAYGVDRVFWCMQFAWWVFREAGAGDLIHPKTAYCPTAYDWFRARGQLELTPQRGDLVFYDWPDSDRSIQHVGIVESFDATSITVIEGNTTAPAGTGDQSDGDGVWRRRRARNASIVGYGRPAWTGQPAKHPSAPSSAGDPFMALTADQQDVMFKAVMMVFAQITGDEDWAGPDAWGWPNLRHDGGPDLTMVDYLRHIDRETNSRLSLDGRPGPDEDTLFGHILSLRAELRGLRSDVAGRLARLAQTGGVPAAVAELDPQTLGAFAKAVVDEQARRLAAPAAA